MQIKTLNHTRTKKLTWWMALTLLLLAALVACAPPAPEGELIESNEVVEAEATDAPEPTEEPAPTDAPSPTDTPEEAMEEETMDDEEMDDEAMDDEAMEEEPHDDSDEAMAEDAGPAVNEDGFFTTDDRNSQLVSLTRDWNTNWELHSINYDDILSGGPPRDGIPSIDDPTFISPEEAGEWLVDTEPVISLEVNGDARAYPIQILTWHEIVNDTVGDVPVVVTFCPLCNSALVFERTVDGEVFEFGVSGLLRNSDLIMYDRTNESLWQQFTGEGIVGDFTGHILPFVGSSLISFADFKAAYPEGIVLSRDTGFSRSYGRNPYAGYDTAGNTPFLFDGPTDDRLDAVARVVTVHFEEEATSVAYPVDLLADVRVINDSQAGIDMAVFFTPGTNSALGASLIAEAEDVGATNVLNPLLNGEKLTFSFDGDNIIDDQTGSIWNIAGQAVEGELAGESLEVIPHADHFWFSWAAFRPDTVIYSADS